MRSCFAMMRAPKFNCCHLKSAHPQIRLVRRASATPNWATSATASSRTWEHSNSREVETESPSPIGAGRQHSELRRHGEKIPRNPAISHEIPPTHFSDTTEIL